ncbi:metalloregulator ArsR/SmtB family transcription factor [Rhizobium sp. LC145]|uniref:ArsR/SmtB family transcription factor n=1 Tax=Rhizobium sp. LC145 TaxID=1120688 RepID=UPI00062A393D|nr:metalloregulator ArsR/SmtB family transcription factor [Rhizobium sp. LC145]KKX29353.1 ArsR family transcriptional regulator [Rhizobium sp. LC145]MDX3927876.1 metalloregulator ArsR/SmtB family transcription factor [Shinella sp.]TKT68963.1 helix-turn-helix transcriptional regulator [Rhizobiaceae bacterium LC148]
MEQEKAILALAALAQPTRLQAFNLLVQHEPDGIPAGDVARMLAIPQNTMSSHLSVLARAGLISAERRSRLIVYRADIAALREVMLYLVKDCCGGRAELCAPLVAELSPCCTPQKVSS